MSEYWDDETIAAWEKANKKLITHDYQGRAYYSLINYMGDENAKTQTKKFRKDQHNNAVCEDKEKN